MSKTVSVRVVRQQSSAASVAANLNFFATFRDESFSFEIIVVDDGSSDNTVSVAQRYVKKFGSERIRVLLLESNRQKGGAVRCGAFCARGKYILMMDADGATQFTDFVALEHAMHRIQASDDRQFGVVCGSRKHLEKEAIAQRTLFRTVLMVGFHFLVATIGGVTEVRDTQCGFKLFSRESARLLFGSLHIERWAFDVELLYLARRCYNMPVAEVPVHWNEVDGSKVSIGSAIPQMLTDLCKMRLFYILKLWNPIEQQ